MKNEKPDLKTRVKNGLAWGGFAVGGLVLVGAFAAVNVLEKVQDDRQAKSELEKIFNKHPETLPDCKNEFGRTFEVDGQSYVLSCTGKPAP